MFHNVGSGNHPDRRKITVLPPDPAVTAGIGVGGIVCIHLCHGCKKSGICRVAAGSVAISDFCKDFGEGLVTALFVDIPGVLQFCLKIHRFEHFFLLRAVIGTEKQRRGQALRLAVLCHELHVFRGAFAASEERDDLR